MISHSIDRVTRRLHNELSIPSALPDVFAGVASTSINQDMTACAFSVAGAVLHVKIFGFLATQGILEQKLSRKLVHITSGPLFIVTWMLYSSNPSARIWASAVPAMNLVRLFLVGSGTVEDAGLVRSTSRSGDRSELLKGPLYYCMVLILCTLLCWRDNPVGIVVICIMCGGDGFADIIGRRFGDVKLPYNPNKSWAGSLAMASAGVLISLASLNLFWSAGFLSSYSIESIFPALLGISLAATLLESLPINNLIDDNLSVPLLVLALGSIYLVGT